LMSSRFPSGPLLIVCYIGAFTSLLAMIYMLIGKSILFTPGRQMTLAWLVFGLELALIAFNIILVFNQGSAISDQGFLAFWSQLAPTTPVIQMASVAVLFFLDEDGKLHHEDVEMAYDLKRAQRNHVKAMARARLRLQKKQLNYLVTELDRAVSSPESLLTIEATARDLNTDLLGQLSGHRYANRALPAPAGVPALPAGNDPTPRPEQAPARPVPVNGPTGPVVDDDKPGLLGQAATALGNLFGGGKSDQQAPASFSQTGQLPAVPATPQFAQPSPADHLQPAIVEHRTCSECPTAFVVKNAKQLTCSPACRSKRARRLAKEKRQHP